MSFKLNDRVQTNHGVGEVTYVEDGYIEVTVDGCEYSYTGTYHDLQHVSEPIAASKPYETPEWDAVLESVPLGPYLMGHRLQILSSTLINKIGEAGEWETLNSFQKLNFIEMAGGLNKEKYKELL